ncbi:WD40 repeat-like protein, partial [Stereum hirsutum FP-91666 SS1]
VSCMAISWDSAVLACGTTDGHLTLWDLSTGGVRSTLDDHSTKVLSVAFTSEHGLLQSGSEDGVIRVWDINRGSFQERELGRKCSLVAFSRLGDRVATVHEDNRTLRLEKIFWRDISSNATAHISGSRIWNVAFSPDGKRVASTSFDHQTLIWDASSGELLPPLPQKGDPPRCWGLALAFSPDGTLLLSGNQDGSALMYRTS